LWHHLRQLGLSQWISYWLLAVVEAAAEEVAAAEPADIHHTLLKL
jgi:hypothetical protein